MNRSRRRGGRVFGKRLKSRAGLRVGCSSKRWHNELFITSSTIRGDEAKKSGKLETSGVRTRRLTHPLPWALCTPRPERRTHPWRDQSAFRDGWTQLTGASIAAGDPAIRNPFSIAERTTPSIIFFGDAPNNRLLVKDQWTQLTAAPATAVSEATMVWPASGSGR
jgi:hypothetical protein